ncbi:hypothetical protein S7335_358 [Synechococcus sp. PCC 7335]|uniref:hypothetical protein n=1 Tax=Synechococcus sp. (strain ATCC 29403 / PCC 7335) TaxID=91464 RepID=UPI00017EDD70|nr:hypothetical protein [Synechococcus sp. PCC 7335]EDX83179.1 hypothetical protein S7335_358 [Synechococcus sp. PCC 7335]
MSPPHTNDFVEENAMESETAKLIKLIRAMPLAQQLIPMEALTGWPMPLRRESNIYVHLPFVGANQSHGKQGMALFPPFALITVDWSNGLPVQYLNLRFQHPWPEGNWNSQAGTFPHPEIAQLPKAEYVSKRQELLAMYDHLLNSLAKREAFSLEWKARFSESLRLLMEPALEPYYRALSPKFFQTFLPHSS